MSMDISLHLPILQVIVPLLAAPLVVLLRPRNLAWAATAAVCLVALAIALQMAGRVLLGETLYYEVGGWRAPFGIALQVDAVNALLLVVVSGAASLAVLGCRESLTAQIEPRRHPLFFSAWLLLLAGLSGMLVSADAFNIFVFMEISSLASYILIAGGPDRRALLAVFKYLVMGTIGATFYLIGVGLIYMMTGTLNLADMARLVPEVADQRPVLLAAGFITVGLALKAALFPLHVWLANAYMHAPHAVSVFLAACGTKVAVYVLLRIDFSLFQVGNLDHSIRFALFLMPLALLGIVVSSAVAMFEGQLKRMLAFSSVAQIGYILLGTSLLSEAGLTSSLLHMFNHALAKSALFLAAACLSMRFLDLRIDALAGAAKQMPLTSAVFVLAGLSLIGIPGTAGFVSKWVLITALLEQGEQGVVMVAIVLISSLMAVAYVWRTVEVLYFKEPAGELKFAEAPPLMLVIACSAALLNLVFGLMPAAPLALSQQAAQMLIGGAP